MPINMKREILEHEIKTALIEAGRTPVMSDYMAEKAADRIEQRYPVQKCEGFDSYLTACVVTMLKHNKVWVDWVEEVKTEMPSNADPVQALALILKLRFEEYTQNASVRSDFTNTEKRKSIEDLFESWLQFSFDCVDWKGVAKYLLED